MSYEYIKSKQRSGVITSFIMTKKCKKVAKCVTCYNIVNLDIIRQIDKFIPVNNGQLTH